MKEQFYNLITTVCLLGSLGCVGKGSHEVFLSYTSTTPIYSEIKKNLEEEAEEILPFTEGKNFLNVKLNNLDISSGLNEYESLLDSSFVNEKYDEQAKHEKTTAKYALLGICLAAGGWASNNLKRRNRK